MDHVPPEIWEQIFTLACTDSGRTGVSLSLVSTYFHHISRLCQYQSVALTRSKHIPLFRHALSHAPVEARRIKYLYVCCPNVFLDLSDEEDDPDYVETPMDSLSRSGSHERMEVGSDSSDEEYEGSPTPEELQEALDESMALSEDRRSFQQEFHDNDPEMRIWDDFDEEIQAADVVILEAFRDILREAASSLLLLSVNWTSFRPLLLEELLPPLPNLVELHLCRAFTSQDEIDPETEDSAPTLFSRLRRLHIYGYLDQRPDSLGRSLGRIAPTLTHIRMPKHYIRSFPPQSARIPDTIQKVILEIFLGGELGGDTDDTLELLFGLGASDSHSKEIEFTTHSLRDDPKAWEDSWLERVMGLRGPW
ncbi:hypothetical protein M413DRAFT_447026 [Hebeloma cylindrosporum]|uniref:Uncharacterized protein n=1 Tax=Hebeloma cylindrosporum TaxID=76867 RepID=A0A0C3C7H9_HEBCY|nr:hypothetical protein M413DRAFT_447026 [Hebeloma cylindrosporum h7]